MEKAQKNLKVLSIVLLVFAALSVIKMIVRVAVSGFAIEGVGVEGLSEEIIKIVAIVSWVISFLFILPEVYVGYKGLKISQEPDKSKAHIIVAIIMLVLAAISTLTNFVNLFNAKDLFVAILSFVETGVDLIVYILYVKTAKEIANAM